MTQPQDVSFPKGSKIEGTLYGRPFSLRRDGDTVLLSCGPEEFLIGLPEQTTALCLGASLGPLPFLVFPRPALVVPAGESLRRQFRIPLHLDIAARATTPLRLREVRPAGLTRSLYGPVDFGWVCWTVRAVDRENAALQTDRLAHPLSALVDVTIENETTAPHDVSKIMIPVDMIGLYTRDDELIVSDVTMTLISDLTAELTIEAPARAKQVSSVLGAPIRPARRAFALSHTYRNKTGLEYGF